MAPRFKPRSAFARKTLAQSAHGKIKENPRASRGDLASHGSVNSRRRRERGTSDANSKDSSLDLFRKYERLNSPDARDLNLTYAINTRFNRIIICYCHFFLYEYLLLCRVYIYMYIYIAYIYLQISFCLLYRVRCIVLSFTYGEQSFIF